MLCNHIKFEQLHPSNYAQLGNLYPWKTLCYEISSEAAMLVYLTVNIKVNILGQENKFLPVYEVEKEHAF